MPKTKHGLFILAFLALLALPFLAPAGLAAPGEPLPADDPSAGASLPAERPAGPVAATPPSAEPSGATQTMGGAGGEEAGAGAADVTPGMSAGPSESPFADEALNEEVCTAAGKSYLVFTAVTDLVLVVLGVVILYFLSKSGRWTHIARWAGAGIAVAVLAAVIIGWNPVKTDIYLACEASKFADRIPLAGVSTWIRGLILGAVPVFALYAAVALALNKTGKL